MTAIGTHLHMARVTLEAETGVSATTGAAHPLFDSLLQRDANGLPCLTGASLAGVLRRFAAQRLEGGARAAAALFGPGDVRREEEMARSEVVVTDALCHLSDDAPIDGFALAPPSSDPLHRLLTAAQLIVRDHVRRGENGVADGRGKFDRTHAPEGTRFTFGLSMRGDTEEPHWAALIAALAGGTLRVGGATRRGLGKLRAIRVDRRSFDLREADERAAARVARRLDAPLGGKPVEPGAQPTPKGIRLTLRPEDGGTFRFGSERSPALSDGGAAKRNMLKMNTEPHIQWRPGGEGDQAEIVGVTKADAKRAAIAPGASVKGALRHRTLFHLRRLIGETSDDPAETRLALLFGAPRDQERSEASRIRVDDLRLAPLAVNDVTRVSIDRFTGGARDGALYSEERLAPDGSDPALSVFIEIEIEDGGGGDETVLKALRMAVEDLCSGRLPLGAGGGKGQGWFEGDWKEEGGIALP